MAITESSTLTICMDCPVKIWIRDKIGIFLEMVLSWFLIILNKTEWEHSKPWLSDLSLVFHLKGNLLDTARAVNM